MRIYMQQLSLKGKPPRFCHLHLQEELLPGWTLIKELGFQGDSGRVTRTHFGARDTALEALLRERDTKIEKGFRVVFTQGDVSPPRGV